MHTSPRLPHTPDPPPREEIVKAFNHCEFARLLGMEIVETWDGGARVVMEIDGKRNPNGVVHGGAIFALADQAFGIAGNHEGVRRVAISAHIHYIVPATGRLEAVAERISQNERTALYRVRVHEGSRLIAEFDGMAIRG
jgi:acyl-CoA thioesterase